MERLIGKCEICGKTKKIIKYSIIEKNNTHQLCKRCFEKVSYLRRVKKLLDDEEK